MSRTVATLWALVAIACLAVGFLWPTPSPAAIRAPQGDLVEAPAQQLLSCLTLEDADQAIRLNLMMRGEIGIGILGLEPQSGDIILTTVVVGRRTANDIRFHDGCAVSSRDVPTPLPP